MSGPTWWRRARDGAWQRWSHRRADWEPAPGQPPEGAPVTGLLAEAPRDAPPPPRVVRTKSELAVRYLWIAALIMAGTMFAIWALSPVWDPFDVREAGVWGAYRGAFPWVIAVTIAGEAIAGLIDRVRRGEPLMPEEPLPEPPEEADPDLQPMGAWFTSLARFLAVGCAVIAVIVLVVALLFASQEPSEVLGTDPQGASRSGLLMVGGFTLAAALLWWAGRDR